ncbi:MAG: iron hydrogenase [Candidatus Pacebacteria bacterium]|nr:iron hydrogenase [Candidatus Paceibacterota bacterium]
MKITKELIINRTETIKKFAVFSTLLGIAVLLPALIHSQAITGPIVNATLFLATFLFSPHIAILIGLLPSLVALATGLLPAPLAPMIPFIMIGNTILILVFYYLKKKNFWLGVTLASLLKFLFLFSTSSLVIGLLLKKELAKNVALMMNWPQLITALFGGVIAYFVLKIRGKK